jgi:hypothetical protein
MISRTFKVKGKMMCGFYCVKYLFIFNSLVEQHDVHIMACYLFIYNNCVLHFLFLQNKVLSLLLLRFALSLS